MTYFEVVCLLVVVGLGSAFPKSGYYPRSYMLGGSYYSNPRYIRDDTSYKYLPPGQMTAMVVGDTVATNSFSRGFVSQPPAVIPQVPEIIELEDDNQEHQQPQEPDVTNETEPEEVFAHHQNVDGGDEQETIFSSAEVTTEAVAVSNGKLPSSKVPSVIKKTKVGKSKRPVAPAPAKPMIPARPAEEDEEEDFSGAWPFGGARKGGVPAYNAFFPIFIGGSPSTGSRTRSSEAAEAAYPGSATAIANAFSTGKGGVATSHATSFGDPYAAAMMRNAGLFNFRRKSSKKQPVNLEEEEDEE